MSDTPIALCPECAAKLAGPEPKGGYRVCERCWDLCLQLPMEHGAKCRSASCRADYERVRDEMYARWGIGEK